MAAADWNWKLATDLQDVAWDCAAASLSWCLRSIGRTETEADVVAGLGPARISPVYGLLDASGAGLVEYLGELGIASANNASATWSDVMAAAGHQPMLMGGRAWAHWVGVRMGSAAFSADLPESLLLMNPAPGYDAIYQVLTPWAFEELGPFSAVWFVSWA